MTPALAGNGTAGGWNAALQNNTNAANDPNIIFQFHHQPFAYFTKYAPFLDAPNCKLHQPAAAQPEHDRTKRALTG